MVGEPPDQPPDSAAHGSRGTIHNSALNHNNLRKITEILAIVYSLYFYFLYGNAALRSVVQIHAPPLSLEGRFEELGIE
jgi:hypothetical protein